MLEHPEHPLDSEVPEQDVIQLEEQADVQSEQSFLVQLVSIGKAPDMAKSPITGKAFFAASLKNSLLFCNSLLFIFCVFIICHGIVL